MMNKQAILDYAENAIGQVRDSVDFIEFVVGLNEFLTAQEREMGRTMTPFEHQWMDFKKILSELVVYLDDYQEQTKDYAPGNRYWGQKLQDIVERARKAIGRNENSMKSGNDAPKIPAGRIGYSMQEYGVAENSELNSEISGQEGEHGELDGYISPTCKCKYCEYGRIKITKRKIEEYMQSPDITVHYYDGRTFIIVSDLMRWLQERDK